MKASWVIGIIGLILMNFGPVEPRMFMVPNQWLMEDMESVSPKVSQMKKVERPEVVQTSDIQPSDITFPKGKIKGDAKKNVTTIAKINVAVFRGYECILY